ncbi:MAG: hypothetical protein QOG36_1460 [Actinomycetota bacterium]|nr:hypothetical protein [Actinomycetota bacterium]
MSDIDNYGDDLFGDAAEPVSVAFLVLCCSLCRD